MRQRGQKNYAPLVLGLNTEASPLGAPEGTTSDELNMVLDTDGMVRRPRKGLCAFFDIPEESNESTVQQTFLGVLGVTYWAREDYIVLCTAYTREVEEEGEEEETINAMYIDRYVYFIHPRSTDIEFQYFWREAIPTYDGEDYPNASDIQRAEQRALDSGITFSPLNEGIVLSTADEPLFIRPNTEGLDVFIIDPQIRDFLLLETSTEIGRNPSTINAAYRYNLLNAGWYENSYKDESGATITNLIERYHSDTGNYPSQAQVPQLGVRVESQTGDRYFSSEELDSVSFGNSEAPRGHYIFPIRRINRLGKVNSPQADGSRPLPVKNILDNGTDPDTGDDPTPGVPIGPIIPPPVCFPGEVCMVEP